MLQEIVQLAVARHADYVGIVAALEIPIVEELRASCEQNYCGKYKTSWMGPPAVGEVAQLTKEIRSYQRGVVIQTVDQLEDSFDYEGMVAAKVRHQAIFRSIRSAVCEQFPSVKSLSLDVGCCHICDTCTYPDKPCSNPAEALASVEAYGINVNDMLTACGLKYNNGKDTVSYVGLILI